MLFCMLASKSKLCEIQFFEKSSALCGDSRKNKIDGTEGVLSDYILLKFITVSKSDHLCFIIVATCVIESLSGNFFLNNHGV